LLGPASIKYHWDENRGILASTGHVSQGSRLSEISKSI